MRVKIGLEIFLAAHKRLVHNRRVGLLTHAAAVGHDLRSSGDLLAEGGVRLAALYGPEHGIRGEAQAGEPVPYRLDARLGIPVYSLYRRGIKPSAEAAADLDARMRRFDTRKEGKALAGEMVRNIDMLVCDLQDVGTRVYTYVATMIYAMETCAEAGIPLVVLDRPNPVTGSLMEGPVLEYPKYASPVGALPVPLRHGLTIGEAALLANDCLLAVRAKLTVIPMEGWRRRFWFDQTGLPWVSPSPNMSTLDTAAIYPGQVFFEGTNVSEARGTTRPFEVIGAPWIDGAQLAAWLNALKLPGLILRETSFTPSFSKYAGTLCSGVQFHVTDRRRFRPFAAMLHAVRAIMDLYPVHFRFHAEYFDHIMGTARIRHLLESGASVDDIIRSYAPELRRFARFRSRYLLYS